MSRKLYALSIVLFFSAAATGCSKSSMQTAPAASAPAVETAKAPQMTEEQMMEAFKKANQLGDNHKLLSGFVGEWTTKVKSYTDPKSPPKESKGSVSVKPIMGGRFLESSFKGTMMGMPFQGREISGFDNTSGKFVSAWIDTMSTNIFQSTGTYNPETKQFNYTGTVVCPVTKENVPVRMVITVPDKNHHKFEWFEKRGEQEVLGMEIDYTRKGTKKAVKN